MAVVSRSLLDARLVLTAMKLCPACRSEKIGSVFCYAESVPIARCLSCFSEFCTRPYSPIELENFYGEGYWKDGYGYANYAALEAIKSLTFTARLKLLEAVLLTSKEDDGGVRQMLDVGCADGLLVRVAQSRGWKAWGVDISAPAIEAARRLATNDENRDTLLQGTIDRLELPHDHFSAVVMSDMIEHVHNPDPVLQSVRALLRPGGVVLLETPHTRGILHKVMGKRWPMYRPPEHLVYFTPRGLSCALQRAGLSVIQCFPSTKAFNLSYLGEKLAVTNPWIAKMVSIAGITLPKFSFWIPSGSFVIIAVRQRKG